MIATQRQALDVYSLIQQLKIIPLAGPPHLLHG
jgi:hypothetical protein